MKSDGTGVTENIVIMGAGVAGLMSALALAAPGRSITVLDRDPPPPEGGADVAFRQWERKGVGQFRQSHAFLARLLNLIRERRPQLLADLLEAGAHESPFEEMLPDSLKATYRPLPSDANLSILVSRRATLEWVLRRHVSQLEAVRIVSGVLVKDLSFGPPQVGLPCVDGVLVEDGAGLVKWAADLVVDAAGRGTRTPEWLANAGAPIEEREEDAGIVYFTRHYRLRGGESAPERSAGSRAGDLGYLKYGLFIADDGWFSITLAAPETETGLRQRLIQPHTFDQVCGVLPGVADWTDPVRSEPQTLVLGMGDLRNRWRRFVGQAGRPAALRLFMVGDGLIRSNPLYGRGCTFAAIEAFALADTLLATADPERRAQSYHAALDAELGPFFEAMVRQDHAAIRRSQRLIDPSARRSLRSRITKSLVEDGVAPALRSDLTTLRAALSAFHMLSPPTAWLRQPRNLLTVMRTWATPPILKRRFYPATLGPDRGEMMQLLGIAA